MCQDELRVAELQRLADAQPVRDRLRRDQSGMRPRGTRPWNRYRASEERWWSSPSGKAAVQWFEAWGLVVRERLVTGDPTAVPTMDGLPGVNRSGPSNIADVQLRYLGVESFLAQSSPRHRDLLEAIYVHSIVESPDWVVYEFADGSFSDQMNAHDDAPAHFVRCHQKVSRSRRYDLSRFVAPEIDAVRSLWWSGKSLVDVLEMEHRRIARWFCEAAGIGQAVPAQVEQAPEAEALCPCHGAPESMCPGDDQ